MDRLEAYLQSVDPRRREDLRRLHALVAETVPELRPCEQDGAPAYGPYAYRYASGRTGRSSLVSLRPTAAGISLHVQAVRPDGQYVAEAAAARLRPATVGRSCIRLRHLDEVDLDALREVLREAVQHGPAAGALH